MKVTTERPIMTTRAQIRRWTHMETFVGIMIMFITQTAFGQFYTIIEGYHLLREESPSGTLLKQDTQEVWQRTNLVWETYFYTPSEQVTQSFNYAYYKITGLNFYGQHGYSLSWSNNGGFSSNYFEWTLPNQPLGTFLGGMNQGWKVWTNDAGVRMTKIVCSTLFASYNSRVDHCNGAADYMNYAFWYRTNAAAVSTPADWFIPFFFSILRGTNVNWYIKTPSNTIWHAMGPADQGRRSCVEPFMDRTWEPRWNSAISTNNLPDPDFCLTSPALIQLLTSGGPITPSSPILRSTAMPMRLLIKALPRQRFTVETSTNLLHWRNFADVTIPYTSTLVIEDTNAPLGASNSNFYRVVPKRH